MGTSACCYRPRTKSYSPAIAQQDINLLSIHTVIGRTAGKNPPLFQFKMSIREEENISLLQDEDEVESKEQLSQFRDSSSNQAPKMPSKTKNALIILLIMSGAVNTLLAILLTSQFFHARLSSSMEAHTESPSLSSYGKPRPIFKCQKIFTC